MPDRLYFSKEILDTLRHRSLKLLILGDSCYDVYHYGTVKRISPEAPIPIFDLKRSETKQGMAANVYQNFKSLGADVDFQTRYCEKKHRYIDIKSNQQLLRVDESIEPQGQTRINYDGLKINDYDAVVISDYGKGFVKYFDYELIREIFKGPIFLDTKDRSLNLYKGAIVKINQFEYEISDRGTALQDLIVTYGGEQVTWRDQVFYPPTVDAHDVCGAGDTFLAALAFCYVATESMPIAIEFAMLAATVTVKHIGVYAPTISEIVDEIDKSS